MARKAREVSGTGIYHVLLRGNNNEDIFKENSDYLHFLEQLRRQAFPEDRKGRKLPSRCFLYAYCLMSNYAHLLIRTTDYGLSSPVGGITVLYAQYFNKKYNHSGHVFLDRFKSEPVNKMAYFVTLLRYIHQIPVAAGVTESVGDYAWSSWCEYDSEKPCQLPVCHPDHVLESMSLEELKELVNDPLPRDLNIMGAVVNKPVIVTEKALEEFFATICNPSDFTEIKRHDKEKRNDILRQLRKFGGSLRQISRITGVSIGVISKVK